MDAIGTPFCITVDHDSIEQNTVTLRDRDSMQQERVSIDRRRDRGRKGRYAEGAGGLEDEGRGTRDEGRGRLAVGVGGGQ